MLGTHEAIRLLETAGGGFLDSFGNPGNAAELRSSPGVPRQTWLSDVFGTMAKTAHGSIMSYEQRISGNFLTDADMCYVTHSKP